jgi:hypothetical protein
MPLNLNTYVDTYFNTYNLLYNNSISNNFKFIKDFPQITTLNSKISLYTYLKQLIINNLNNITQEQYNNIINILTDNDYDMTNNITDIISSDDFYHIDDILDIIFPNKDYINYEQYINLKKLSDAKLPIQSIQYHTNKLFHQLIDEKYNYYFYFSFGTLKNIELIDWLDSLKIYVQEIKKLLSDERTKNIILAGHSVGSIVIQKLCIELINNNIDISNIYIIGTGCRMINVLTDVELNIFRQNFNNRYIFIISAYIENNKIHYDHRNDNKEINKINTHILICNRYELKNNYNSCKSVSFDILNYNEINNSNNYIPDPNIILHEFITYSKLYLNMLNK